MLGLFVFLFAFALICIVLAIAVRGPSANQPPHGEPPEQRGRKEANHSEPISPVDTVTTNRNPQHRKKKWREKPNNWINLFTLLFVGGYTILTYCSLQIGQGSLSIAGDAQRAWLAPTKFSLVDPNDADDPLRVRVFYQNVGREPAKGVRNWIATFIMTNPELSPARWSELSAWKDDKLKPRELCKHDPGALTSVAYPSTNVGFSIETTKFELAVPGVKDFAGLVTGVKNRSIVYVVVGCLAYETRGRKKYSSFCAFINPAPGHDFPNWDFSACPVGNDDFGEDD